MRFAPVVACLLLAACGGERSLETDCPTGDCLEIVEATEEQCPHGGVVLLAGEHEHVLCNGAPSEPGLAVRIVDVPPGEICEHGGFKLEYGADTKGDGVLGDDEPALGSAHVCNGSPAEAPEIAIEAAGEGDCPHGGSVVTVDGDSFTVCNGEPGQSPELTVAPASESECPYGGTVVTLDGHSFTICSGAPGAAPEVSVAPAGEEECPNGGSVITVGGESFAVCEGEPGDAPVVRVRDALWEECRTGGHVVTIGDESFPVCHGGPELPPPPPDIVFGVLDSGLAIGSEGEPAGLLLEADNTNYHAVVADNLRGRLFLSTFHSTRGRLIEVLSLDDMARGTLVTLPTISEQMAFDEAAEVLVFQTVRAVSVLDLRHEASQPSAIVEVEAPARVSGVSVHPLDQRIFFSWKDGTGPVYIEAVDYDGSNRQVLYEGRQGGVGYAGPMALDVYDEALLFSDGEQTRRLDLATMEAGEFPLEGFKFTSPGWGGLAVDPRDRSVYYLASDGSIARARPDGGGVEKVIDDSAYRGLGQFGLILR